MTSGRVALSSIDPDARGLRPVPRLVRRGCFGKSDEGGKRVRALDRARRDVHNLTGTSRPLFHRKASGVIGFF